ncbi:hypothetical protein AJ80_07911 [Polytolypa hystricis UAMH7299]|uniref:FAD-binding FR-type domain-containing protein n=1 Tax=Polytolypa hystricis (strain UAMH7299) TaxID=1447883 RepID=A0A2B7XHI9_POLH7|nr:hypothetical protein AJ80_07911 [Polytolypa hystricis UAMH7299]
MAFPLLLVLLLAASQPCLSLIGVGIEMYNPPCAYACYDSLSSAPLACSTPGEGHGGHGGHGGGHVTTTPECRASDGPYLTTLAWCVSSNCAQFGIEDWRLEKFWSVKATNNASVAAKWGFHHALMEVGENEPKEELATGEMLNKTVLVPHATWQSNRLTLEHFEVQEGLHARYGFIILLVGFGLPILVTAFTYLPFTSTLVQKIKPILVYPPVVGSYHVRSLPYLLGNPPTAGHSIYIAIIFALNVILSAVGYHSTQPNAWFASKYQEILAYISCRTGVIAFALAPLVILFAGRNNILLWLTNWSHSTYMLLHRWVARIFAIQVIVHSIVELVLYIANGTYEAELVKEYWIWGCVATVAVCAMLLFSILYVRRLSYETFLIIHIILAVFVLVGSWYHVEFLFQRKWGYEMWLYAAFVVWFFDRLMRVLRIAKVGFRHSRVTEVAEDIVRVDVEGVRWRAQPGQHAYAHFPGLSPWRLYENHPFSVIPTTLLQARDREAAIQTTSSQSSQTDIEKTANDVIDPSSNVSRSRPTTTAGVSFYIKRSRGLTKYLHPHENLLTLLDGPYRNNHVSNVLKCDRLVLLAGGIGVTGLVAFTEAHPNVKLYWSLKSVAAGLARDLQPALDNMAEKEVSIGERFDIESLLAREAKEGWGKIGVVTCGPGGLCDGVREVVVKLSREGSTEFELSIDAFSW